MTIFSDAVKDIIQDSAMKTAATFRNATLYGHYSEELYETDGVSSRAIIFEYVTSDLDQAPEEGETIAIGDNTFSIIAVDTLQHDSTILTLSKDVVNG